jgi:ABC-type cobalamin/Fe3+-siderophores transport system ATPase subunit
MSRDIRLPNGDVLSGTSPMVIIGPNGSGKTRLAHQLQAIDGSIEFVNALRNTRVSPEIPAMAVPQARSNLQQAKNQSRQTHWEQTNDFDQLLAKLQAEDAQAAIEFRDSTLAGSPVAEQTTAMQRIRALWSEVFPGRTLAIRDNAPIVKSEITGEYSGNTMSDGEKAALYLAGHVINGDPGILVIDEPETHFHSLLAVRFWDALEKERPDVRFVYITHDLAFARSRRDAALAMASPSDGLRVLDVDEQIPTNVAELILGVATLSFYAKRIVICEGDEHSIDASLYRAWFSGRDTEVEAVGSCAQVMQCATAMQTSGLVSGLDVVGIIDRDFYPEAFLNGLPSGVTALPLHEVESLYCLPAVARAVTVHLGKQFDEPSYDQGLRGAITNAERHKVIVERWKRSLEPKLQTLLVSVSGRVTDLDSILTDIPTIFDANQWDFDPRAELERQKNTVEASVPAGEVLKILELMPGKGLCAYAANFVGLQVHDYRALVDQALIGREPTLRTLGGEIEQALQMFLPPRQWQEPAEPADVLLPADAPSTNGVPARAV